MNANQDAVWKQISHVYAQWDPSRSGLMPVRDLAESLPLSAWQKSRMGEDPTFRPLQQ